MAAGSRLHDDNSRTRVDRCRRQVLDASVITVDALHISDLAFTVKRYKDNYASPAKMIHF
uniref:Uncharacterized protein n=1 Tax=Oryza sativa subsp. japonica TaxID=39947 RepID=Q0ZHC4_ORYSJ|nr:hypothetical protein b29O05.2 [Oryza sativa Japonica Group]